MAVVVTIAGMILPATGAFLDAPASCWAGAPPPSWSVVGKAPPAISFVRARSASGIR